ncbi:PIR Superfamily Protein [Plasmodium ovale curtisi]|uniref:PIR Superfamily Protein n=1 Tax=Plasmodium ovale curtisi TaxID=864141 RepID=A0A1A8WNR1_PLAOA|nr:PIR Superfamily Protein [Plasmodium ovale curtisi]
MAESEINNLIKRLNNFTDLLNTEEESYEIQKLYDHDKNNFYDVFLNSTLNKLRRNYKVYEANYDLVSYDMYCRYLNYWLNKKRNRYNIIPNSPANNTFYDKVDQYYTNEKENVHGNNGPCPIKRMEYSSSALSIINKLDDLCYIRSQFVEKQKIMSNKNECFAFYKYMYNTMTLIFQNMLSYTNKDTISIEDLMNKTLCVENNIHDFFTEIKCDYNNLPSETYKCVEGEEQCNLAMKESLDYHCNNNYHNILLSIFLTALGTLLIFFFLYRFSPLGLLLNKRTEKKKKIRNNIEDEVMNVYHDDNTSHGHETSQILPYHLSYNSLRN